MMNKQSVVEEMINFYLCDKNADVTGSKIGLNSCGSTCVYVQYTISNEYAEYHDLWNKDREMCIILQRAEGDAHASVVSYAKVNN